MEKKPKIALSSAIRGNRPQTLTFRNFFVKLFLNMKFTFF
jgi:hypothetical protein